MIVKEMIRPVFRWIGKTIAIPMLEPEIVNVEDTLRYIYENKVSVSRYGDGELKWAIGRRNKSFQEQDKDMQRRLKEIIRSDSPKHIVCILNCFDSMEERTLGYQDYWYEHIGLYRLAWYWLLRRGKTYYSAEISRCYLSYQDKRYSERDFALWKQIWQDRNVLLVEGEKSRVGVGNDLFCNVLLLRRILIPAENAYGRYQEILNTISRIYQEGDLILIAAGPTATILAYDLSQIGCQAIDIGHVDIEYEWYLHKAKERTTVTGKYVNEMSEYGGTIVGESNDAGYLAQIAAQIR